MLTRVTWAAAGVCCLALVVAAPAGEGDKDFLAKAISAQIAEIKFAELAERNAASAEVKDFAKIMIRDHTKLRDQLLDRAKAHKLAVVQGLEKEYKQKMERLSKLEGGPFDREYMKMMVEGHQQSVKTFERHAKTAEDPELRTLLTNTLPRVREHLKHAEEISSKLK